MNAPWLAAEIGCNHQGDPVIALEMMRMAADCGVPAVKLQKRCVREVLTDAEYAAPHPEPRHSHGATYGEHRERLEFDLDIHKQLLDEAHGLGLQYGCSVWDPVSAREMTSLQPDFIKIPSACNTHTALVEAVLHGYRGPVHLSLGMTTPGEVEAIVSQFERSGRGQDLVLYHCVSAYPVSPEDSCLLEIARLHAAYGDHVRGIGFSGHHEGIALDSAAFALGARWFERHVTLDRRWKGSDHAASLEPKMLRQLWLDLQHVAAAWHEKPPALSPCELPSARKLKWNRPATHQPPGQRT